ncbi:MAG: asparagine synthase (glutamine-hydrolyzing), partial [Gammaproteobacteria bacterium]
DMCGITGFLTDSASSEVSEHVLREMTEALDYRGPDAEGVWRDPPSGMALGHRRLSIVDLTSAGAQPMHSSCDTCVISYNGEIYNANDLRQELEKSGKSFRGHSDTEVIVEACAAWGIKRTVEQLIGMFALALWDRSEKKLYLVRDRLGIKPLYWGRFGGLFLFGSELKALRAHPGWQPEINRDALVAYMRHNYIPAPLTIYKGIHKLPPGSILTLKRGEEHVIERYWEMDQVAQTGMRGQWMLDDREATEQLEALLGDAVCRRMIADVPLGALLSGGIDSSTVVALMQAHSNRPVRTFSIGFHESGYNEAQHAKAVAKHLGTEHTELYVTPAEAREVIPLLSEIHDEPFADSSQIPTYLVSKLTRRHVTVALSGDGGDEGFAGYNRYFHGRKLMRTLGLLPGPVKGMMGHLIRRVSPDAWTSLNRVLPGGFQIPQFGDKAYKLAELLAADPALTYQRMVSHWDPPSQLVREGQEPESLLLRKSFAPAVQGIIERMQLLDTVTYLPDDILTKVDRASMAVSLEARVPLLDHRVLEFAWRLPLRMKVRHGRGKWILRQILYKHVPKELVERPKMGFAVPVGAWLRGPLREWAEELLDENRMREQGMLNPEPIHKKWREHLAGKGYWQYLLWDVLMFQAWYARWMT